jgi:hypothetical protein
MYMDTQLLFTGTLAAPAQAITATAASVNNYDNGVYPGTVTNGYYDVGPGDVAQFIAAVVTQSFNNLTSLTIAFQTAQDSGFATNLVTHFSNTTLLAGLTAGTVIPMPGLVGILGTQRFWRLYFTVTGTAPTTGAIEAGIVHDLQANRPAPTLQTA